MYYTIKQKCQSFYRLTFFIILKLIYKTMKHIKEFETLLKYDSPKVLNHIFKDFSEKLKKILFRLKELDNFKGSSVKIYFDNSGEISITYRYKYTNLLKIRLLKYNRPSGLELSIILEIRNYDDFKSHNDDMYNIMTSVINKYQTLDDDIYWKIEHIHDIKIQDVNDLTILDNIIREIEEEFNFYISTKKFNI